MQVIPVNPVGTAVPFANLGLVKGPMGTINVYTEGPHGRNTIKAVLAKNHLGEYKVVGGNLTISEFKLVLKAL